MADYTYDLLDSGTARITKYDGDEATVIIPDVIDGHPVTVIGAKAFEKCTMLKTAVIPEGVTTVCADAFFNCEALTEVTVPDSAICFDGNPVAYSPAAVVISPNHPVLELVDGVLFDRINRRLLSYPLTAAAESYEIPNGTVFIGKAAFFCCSTLTNIVIPDSVIAIEERAFVACKFKCLTVPGNVKTIGAGAFGLCNALETLTLSEGVTTIGDRAFMLVSKIAEITLPDSVTSIGILTFFGCLKLSSITLPKGLTAIADGLLSGCIALKKVTIPDGVTTIGEKVFDNCLMLATVTLPAGVTDIGESMFHNSFTTVTVPAGSPGEQTLKNRGVRYVAV